MKVSDIEVTYLGGFGSDLTVVDAARVSMHKESNWNEEGDLFDKDVKLIKYLSEHKHFSPFNHAFLSFRVKAPIFVARQLVKHKFMPWNEVSRRYVDEEPEFYQPILRKRATNVKQGSLDEDLNDERSNHIIQMSAIESLIRYRELIKRGCCPEQARTVLDHNLMTEWIWSGTLGAFLDMLVLRLDPHTQQETREVANKIALYVEEQFPVSYKYRVGV